MFSRIFLVYYVLILAFFAFEARIFIRGLRDWQMPRWPARILGALLALLALSPTLVPMGNWMAHGLLFLAGMLAGWFVFLFFRRHRKWRPVACLLLGSTLVLFGVLNAARVSDTHYALTTEKPLPEGGLDIALISDLHLRGEKGLARTQNICQRIEAADTDAVILAGDLFDEQTTPAEISEAARLLGEISAPTFYVYGNHDGGVYGMASWTEKDVENALEAAGISVLRGEYEPIEGAVIYGREDMSMSGLPVGEMPEGYRIVIDHQPSRYEESMAAGADLQLSGHTHAGQIFPIGQMGVLLGLYDIHYGLLQKEEFSLIVSSGCGNWRYDLRTSYPCEIVYIHVAEATD